MEPNRVAILTHTARDSDAARRARVQEPGAETYFPRDDSGTGSRTLSAGFDARVSLRGRGVLKVDFPHSVEVIAVAGQLPAVSSHRRSLLQYTRTDTALGTSAKPARVEGELPQHCEESIVSFVRRVQFDR